LRHVSTRNFGVYSAIVRDVQALSLTEQQLSHELRFDPDEPWWLQCNYAPVHEELTTERLPVEGALPPELDGLYLRNGANPKRGGTGHWFLGDGMVHGVRLSGGRALWYRNRWLQTPMLDREPRAAAAPPTLTETASNVALVHHAGRLLSLGEVGLPYELSARDLSTVGPYDFAGRLATNMTAHPKIDPRSGELLMFGYDFMPPYLTYHRVGASGRLERSVPIDLPGPAMMHDFGITARHVVFMDLPIVFNIGLAILGRPLPFCWHDGYGARLGVMPREGGSEDVRWFEIEPCFMFHVLNAYENSAGAIVLEAARYERLWDRGSAAFDALPSLYRYTLDLQSGRVRSERVDDRAIEFPAVDPRRVGHEHRYGYALDIVAGERGVPGGTRAVLKYDLRDGSVREHAFHAAERSDELIFVPASPHAAEDEGYLLGYLYDRRTDRSQLAVFDASDLARGPLARVHLPQRVPFGFHGLWVPSA
jgi:carotenoid cleavage dioxygenase-like enzyme